MGKIQRRLREIQVLGKRTREFLINSDQCPPLRERDIALSGISWTSEEFHIERLQPKILQLLIGVEGEGEVWIDGEWHVCRPGQGYLTPVQQPHAQRARRGWQFVWTLLYPSTPLAFPDRPTLREMNPEPMLHILHGLYLEARMGADMNALGYWSELLWHALTELVEAPSSRLWRLWKQVQEHPGEDWTLKRLASAANLGAENLRLICRRELGRSPVEHVTHLRMQHASSLLRAGHKVEFAARCVGYENPFAFSTAFKRIIGLSPSKVKDSAFEAKW